MEMAPKNVFIFTFDYIEAHPGTFAFAVNHLKCPHLHDTELQLVFQVHGIFSLTTEGSF